MLGGIGAAAYLPVLLVLGFSPRTTDIGYQPRQPVEFSHAVHVGQLGMDCRSCHTTVDKAAFAAIPPTQSCTNCHAPDGEGPSILADSRELEPVHESARTGEPIDWVKVHDMAGFAYFDHAAHVNKGIGCVTCHGRVDRMDVVYQAETMSMAWCLDCHRDPSQHLRPLDRVTDMTWTPEDDGTTQEALGRKLMEQYNIQDSQYMMNCSLCHR